MDRRSSKYSWRIVGGYRTVDCGSYRARETEGVLGGEDCLVSFRRTRERHVYRAPRRKAFSADSVVLALLLLCLQLLGYAKDALQLSPLGWQLSRLPVGVAMGKLLVLGALFGSLDTTLTLAAILNAKTQLFSAFKYGRDQADEAKRKLACTPLYPFHKQLLHLGA